MKIALWCATLAVVVLFGFLVLHRSKEAHPLARSIYGADFDCSKALSPAEFIRTNAEAGHAKSQDRLAGYYFHGYEEDKKIKSDRAEAIKWYRLAAEQGNMDAQAHLGILYASDLGIVAPNIYEAGFARKFKAATDYAEAARWFALAAAQGDVNSQYYLSYQFRDGLGVKQNYEEAYFWMGLVVLQRTRDRYDRERDNIAGQLTAEQLESVKQRIVNWKPTVTIPKQKDLLDLPWELCTAIPNICRAASDADMVSFHCTLMSGSPNYIVNKKTNEIESEKGAPY